MKILSLYDKKAGRYGNPFTAVNNAVAVRDFAAACKEPKTPMAMFPDDIELRVVGEFNERTGQVFPNFTTTKGADGKEKREITDPITLTCAKEFVENGKGNDRTDSNNSN